MMINDGEISKWKIPRVPLLMRLEERNDNVFNPMVVSLGPYHHGKPELQICEEAKSLTLKRFVDGSGHDEKFFYELVLENIGYLRSCYVEGSTNKYSDDGFASMMLLDACFLIYLLGVELKNSSILTEGSIYVHLRRIIDSLARRDIFLLENQIPLQLPLLLINTRNGKNEAAEALSKSLTCSIWGKYKDGENPSDPKNRDYDACLCLLDAYHRALLWDQAPKEQHCSISVSDPVDAKKEFIRFRSATDLKAKGIRFESSCNRSLMDVKFTSFTLYGKLELPHWFVSSLSRVFFPNMIAYELYSEYYVEPITLSYISFMKSLIETPADVKLLREKGVFLVSMSSDEEVNTFFNEMNTYGWDFTKKRFQEVSKRIQNHYDSRSKTWIAELMHTYFSSPWSVVAWFAALVLLVLTLLQTIYTIKSS